MGAVYLAWHEALDRNVAIKLIRRGFLSSGFSLQSLIRREAMAAAQLHHRNIVAIHDVDENDGRVFIVLEYVEGRSLGQKLKDEGPLAPNEAARLVADLASATHHAHESGIVHRDLKPSQYTPRPKRDAQDYRLRPGQVDAGPGHRRRRHLLDGSGPDRWNSCLYVSRASQGGNDRIGPATDIFSLGAILYGLLTGQAPFRGESVAQTLANLIERIPASLREVRPGIPRQVEAICMKCLEKPPERRYASAARPGR